MEKVNLIFKEDIEFKGKEYKAGFAYEIEAEKHEIDRLTRRGCIFAGKDAKYYKEEETKQEKPVKKKARRSKKVKEDVDHKNDSEQAEIQADDSLQD